LRSAARSFTMIGDMALSDFDTWLRELDPELIRREIQELRDEQAAIERKIWQRQHALTILGEAAPPARTDEPRLPTPDQPPLDPEDAADMDRGPREGETVIEDMREKEQLLLGILRETPGGALHLREVRKLLGVRSIHFEGTPPRGVLWRLAQRGELESRGQGVYALPAPDGGADATGTQR